MPIQHFLNLSIEKQQMILDACIEEFAQFGYDLGSTNRIVERAGISKGVLFKYFSDKLSLFLYISEWAANKVIQALQIGQSEMPDDFLEAIKLVALKESKFYQQNPRVFVLFEQMAKHPEHPIYEKVLHSYTEKSKHLVEQLMHTLTKSHLQPGVSIDQAMTLVTWVADGIKRKYRQTIPDHPSESEMELLETEIMQELDRYFELLKYGIYQSVT